MLEKLLLIVLLVIFAMPLTVFLQKNNIIPPHTLEKFQEKISEYNIFEDHYKSYSLEGLVDELRMACIDSKLDKIDVFAKEIRKRAELVIVGKVKNTNMQWQEYGASGINGNYYLDLAVESVTKGKYPRDYIRIYCGSLDSDLPDIFVPPGVKKRYVQGDRVRVFLNYSPQREAYVIAAWLFGIDPL